MNQFKEELQEISIKRIDEEIGKWIQKDLTQLEEMAELKEDKRQIFDRKQTILNLLISFDSNIEIIQEVKIQEEKKYMTHTEVLDRVIGKKVGQSINQLYKNIVKNEENSESKNKKMAIVIAREVQFRNLWTNFDFKLKKLLEEQKKKNKGRIIE